MPQIIIKTARDRDQYLIWSTNVDNAVAGPGTREEVKRWLLTKDRTRWTADEVERILERADANGSSDRAVRFGWWDDEFLSVVEGSPNDGWYHLRRDRLADYADALLRDDEAAAVALLECWRRHGEDD
jgi:hypothetical protein